MKLRYRAGQKEAPPHQQQKGCFRTIYTVAADTILNKTYDFRVEAIEKEARKAPKPAAEVTKYVTRYAFWVPIALACNLLAKKLGHSANEMLHHAGPIGIYSIASAHIYAVSFFVRKIAAMLKPGRAIDSQAEANDCWTEAKPTSAKYIGSYALVDPAFVVAYASVATLIAGIPQKNVHPFLGACAVAAGLAVGLAVDCALFGLFFAKKVLRAVPKLGMKDELLGFFRGMAEEFRPVAALKDTVKLVGSIMKAIASFVRGEGFGKVLLDIEHEPRPAEGAGAYAGQLWGVMESHFVWIQAIRIIFAMITAAIAGVQPALFISQLWSNSVKWGIDLVGGLILARYYSEIDRKIGENNRALGLDSNDSGSGEKG